MKQISTKSHRCEITERDYKLLRFLWKWKAVSTMGIARKFFPGIQPLSAYRRLMHLEVARYIKSIEVNGRWQDVWSLSDRGFKHILPKLGDLQHCGYKSENSYHDYLCTAFHLGEWLTQQPDNSQTYSEQQLRRFPMDAWPSWVPQSQTHRPDGYSVFDRGSDRVTLAFEVELSVKARSRYESVVAFYDSQDSIDIVFWLVKSKVILNSIKKSFDKFHLRRVDLHQFILLNDFERTGWAAPIVSGKFEGKSLKSLIHQNNVRSPSNASQDSDTLALLDSRKYPIHSNSCQLSPICEES